MLLKEIGYGLQCKLWFLVQGGDWWQAAGSWQSRHFWAAEAVLIQFRVIRYGLRIVLWWCKDACGFHMLAGQCSGCIAGILFVHWFPLGTGLAPGESPNILHQNFGLVRNSYPNPYNLNNTSTVQMLKCMQQKRQHERQFSCTGCCLMLDANWPM